MGEGELLSVEVGTPDNRPWNAIRSASRSLLLNLKGRYRKLHKLHSQVDGFSSYATLGRSNWHRALIMRWLFT